MTIEDKRVFNINRVAVLYRDLLSDHFHKLSDSDKELLLSLKPTNKIVAIGNIDSSNWNAYPLTYLLDRKLVAPTVLDESKIYQSIQAMRTHNTSIVHPQNLISQSVVIRIVGLDNSANINDYINTFINMCIASDNCKIIFVVVDGDLKFYKNCVYTRKYNSSFIDLNSPNRSAYKVEGSPLCIHPDSITFFGNKLHKRVAKGKSGTSNGGGSCSSLIDDPDFI